MCVFVCLCTCTLVCMCTHVCMCTCTHVCYSIVYPSVYPKDAPLQWVLALSILQFSAKASQVMKQERWVQSLSREDPLEEEMITHCSILAWEIPWTEEPGRLQSRGSKRVGHENL